MAPGCAPDDPARLAHCRDTASASHLKLISMLIIFLASVVGVTSPVLLSHLFRRQPAYAATAAALLLIKSFAAGVILSTSLVHVLPDANDAISDCRVSVRSPWRDFPFSGLACLAGVLLALLVDVIATSHHAGNASLPSSATAAATSYELIGKAVDAEEKVEMGGTREEDEDERLAKVKQRMVSQVLEIGVIFHSIIIGATMGMSQNQCTIRPLVAALAFHQAFEGMGLGGCIAQAGFGPATTAYMCIMFSATTPTGIALGMAVFRLTGYDDDSPKALVSEGLLGSLSSGVLVYMALVDLVAADFFHGMLMSSSPKLKWMGYAALVLGSASMSMLALWA